MDDGKAAGSPVRRMRKGLGPVLSACGASALLLFALDVTTGSTLIPFGDVLAVLTGQGGVDESVRYVVLHFRLPRALTAASAGAGLALSGLFMQTLFRNPLAGPSVLGITAGANLGAAVAVLLIGSGIASGFASGIPAAGRLLVILSSVAGAALVMMIVLSVARFVGSVTVVLLLGIMFGYVANSLVSVLIHFSAAERVQSYIQWSFGSFDATVWPDLWILLPAIFLVYAASLALATFPAGRRCCPSTR